MNTNSPIHNKEFPDEYFRDIEGLKLHSIIKEWMTTGKKFKNATLEGFLNGEREELQESQLNNLGAINSSFRLTNIQLYEPTIIKISEEFYNKTKKVLTANLYFTPHNEAQCFNWHSDNQSAFIYQLEGKKKWSFLKTEDEFVQDNSELETVLKKFTSGNLSTKEVNYNLEKGDWLKFPYCLLHKAENEGRDFSVHITFAYNHPTVLDLAKFIHGTILGGDHSENYFKPVDMEKYNLGLNHLFDNVEDLNEKFLKYYNEVEEEKKLNGRPYA